MSRWERYAPLTGVMVVVLTAVSLILVGSTPDFVDEPQKIVDHYTDDPGKLIIALYIDSLAAVFLLWFVGSVRSALRTAEGGTGRLSAVAFGGGVASAALFLAYDMANLAAAFRADEDKGLDPAVAASLFDLGNVFLGVAAPIASAVLVGAAALVALRTGTILPRWLAWVSLPVALLLASPFGWIGLPPLLLWYLVVSILLFVRQDAASGPAVAPVGAGPS